METSTILPPLYPASDHSPATFTTDNATHNNLTNTTTSPAEDVDAEFKFVLYSVVVPFLFGLITVVGIGGNVLVVYVILSRQKMRTVTNIMLLNLAVSDLSFLVICPPFTAYQYATNGWPFGKVVCKLMHYLLNVTVYVTIYTLVVVSMIRYMTVVHNQRTAAFRTKRNTIIMVVVIWLLMLSLNVPIINSYTVVEYEGAYICDNHGLEVGQRLYATFFAFAYVLPLFVIAVFSLAILSHLKKQRPTTLDKHKSRSSSRKRKASRLLVLVVVIFALFWLPVHLHLLVAYYHSIPNTRPYLAISVLWNCLAYFNSCVNPIIYNYASKDFRDAFRDVVCCALSSKGPSSSISSGGKTRNGEDHTLVTRLPATTAATVREPEENGKEKLLGSPEDDGVGGEGGGEENDQV